MEPPSGSQGAVTRCLRPSTHIRVHARPEHDSDITAFVSRIPPYLVVQFDASSASDTHDLSTQRQAILIADAHHISSIRFDHLLGAY